MLDSLFYPRGVAVIGASSRELHIGNRIIRNLLKFKYRGSIFPVNPKSNKICGLRAYKSILDIKDKIDVAHIVIPAKFVPMAVEDCGKQGVKNVIINSGGFSETGAVGTALQSDFMVKALEYGIRILGPNCQGIINSSEQVKAYCNFTFTFPKPGNISIVALSGGVAELIHQSIVAAGAGTRIYASNGNACDISVSEIIQYLGDDPGTQVIVTYIEGIKEPENFMKALKEVSAKKPILAMKAGRTLEGSKAAASHTGGLAKQDMVADLIFKKAGVLSFHDEGRMIDSAVVLASQPIPKGNHVGIITNTGGPAVIATDVLVEAGFSVPKLRDETINKLKTGLHKEASVGNPVDVLATGTAQHYRHCLDTMLFDDGIDSIFISFVTPFFVDAESIAIEIVKANSKKNKPIVCNLMTDRDKWAATEKILKDGGVPCFALPTDAAYALGSLKDYSCVLSTDQGVVSSYENIDSETVSEILRLAKKNKQSYLLADQVYEILNAYGIKTPGWCVVDGRNNVQDAARSVGYPVVLKADSSSIIHKSDVGGVYLNLRDEFELEKALSDMIFDIDTDSLRFLVQKYIPGDFELICGAKFELGIGHVIMFGLGGIFVEVFKDLVFKLTPITDVEAINMVKSMKSSEIFSGVRGKKSIDIELLAELIQRLSRLVSDFSEIKELDFNPVVVSMGNAVVLDARIVLNI